MRKVCTSLPFRSESENNQLMEIDPRRKHDLKNESLGEKMSLHLRRNTDPPQPPCEVEESRSLAQSEETVRRAPVMNTPRKPLLVSKKVSEKDIKQDVTSPPRNSEPSLAILRRSLCEKYEQAATSV